MYKLLVVLTGLIATASAGFQSSANTALPAASAQISSVSSTNIINPGPPVQSIISPRVAINPAVAPSIAVAPSATTVQIPGSAFISNLDIRSPQYAAVAAPINVASPIVAAQYGNAPIATAPIAAAPIRTASYAAAPYASTASYATTQYATSPFAAAPIATAPIATAPIATAPIVAAPIATAPISTAPIASAPILTAPVASAAIAPASIPSTYFSLAPYSTPISFGGFSNGASASAALANGLSAAYGGYNGYGYGVNQRLPGQGY